MSLAGLTGGVLGYLLLHPASMLIHGAFENSDRTWQACLEMSFSAKHLGMGLYFVALGALVGAVVGFYAHKVASQASRLHMIEGLLPICSYCKLIRDDSGTEHGNGQWMSVETYFTSRSDAEFSHSICPDCYAKLMQDLDE